MSQAPNDPMTEYLWKTADFIRAQKEDDGSMESEAMIDAILDELDTLWYRLTPSQIAAIDARLNGPARAVFVPAPSPLTKA